MKRNELFSTLIELRKINEEKPKEYLENLYIVEKRKKEDNQRIIEVIYTSKNKLDEITESISLENKYLSYVYEISVNEFEFFRFMNIVTDVNFELAYNFFENIFYNNDNYKLIFKKNLKRIVL
jgi:hypothetical protein